MKKAVRIILGLAQFLLAAGIVALAILTRLSMTVYRTILFRSRLWEASLSRSSLCGILLALGIAALVFFLVWGIRAFKAGWKSKGIYCLVGALLSAVLAIFGLLGGEYLGLYFAAPAGLLLVLLHVAGTFLLKPNKIA